MVLCDGNVWLALTFEEHAHHVVVRSWFEGTVEPESLAFCRATQQSYLRLVTTAAILRPYGYPPLTNEQAWDAYGALRRDYRISFIEPEPRGLDEQWKHFALRDTASPKLWMDAYLAAFAVSGGFQLVSTDQAFRQFHDLDLLLLSGTS